MAARQRSRLARLSILAVALVAAGWLAVPAAAQGLDKLDTSLKLVPEDAAFYSSMLRNREQFEAVRDSNVWAKVQEMPIVQMALSMYDMQLGYPNSGPAKLEAALENPETRKIIDLAVDMVSDEIFLYGDQSFADALQLLQALNSAQSFGPLLAQATGQAGGGNPNELQARMVMSALVEHIDLIGVPNLVIGFKVKNADLAKEQMIKLETIGNILLESNEQTKGRFKKTKVGDHEYLVLNLDGSLVPWDELPMDTFAEMEAEEGDAQKIVDRLKESKLVIALGTRDDYLLVSIGSSLECLEKLGQDGRLIDRPEFKPLEKFVDNRLTSISYVSEQMNRQINNQKENIDNLRNMADELLPKTKLTDEQKEQIQKDIGELADDLKGLMPEAGAMMSLSFLCDRGIEGYQYNWVDQGRLDSSKPLGLLQHAGGNPILGIVARGKVDIAQYDMMAKWAKTGYGYFEQFGLPNIPEEDREKIETFLASALPLIERMDKVNREMLIPATADGQSALVIDAKLQSKHFIEALPATEDPMPMLEPAIVMGVSDAKLLKEGLGEYHEIVNSLIDALRQVEGTEIPEDVKIPDPEVTETSQGTIYTFALPKEWGVDEKIVPTFGLSDDVAVFAISREHAERLLKATPLAAGGLLDKTERPLAAAVWLDWAALVDAAVPWVDYAAKQAASSNGVDDVQQEMVLGQVHTGLDVLKALRCITAEVYVEDGASVTHTLVEIQDVKE